MTQSHLPTRTSLGLTCPGWAVGPLKRATYLSAKWHANVTYVNVFFLPDLSARIKKNGLRRPNGIFIP